MTGLIISGLGLDQVSEEVIRKRWDTFSNVEEEFHAMGFTERQKPTIEVIPITKDSLINTSPEQHAEMYISHRRWLDYTLPITALIKGHLLPLANEKKDLAASIRKKLRKEARDNQMRVPSAEEMEDEVLTNPRYRELSQDEQFWKSLQARVEAEKEVMEGNLALISREIEIKKVDAHVSGVGSNIPNRLSPPPQGRWAR